jgi:hypothetical protein
MAVLLYGGIWSGSGEIQDTQFISYGTRGGQMALCPFLVSLEVNLYSALSLDMRSTDIVM